MGRPFPLKIAHFRGEIGTPTNTQFFGPIQGQNANISSMISVGSAVLEQFTAECPYALLCATPPTQNCPFSWGIWTPSNKWFLGLTGPQNLNGISIGSIVLQDSLL